MQFYRVSGLSVASEIDLPGLIAGAPARTPQVTIRRGEVPEELSGRPRPARPGRSPASSSSCASPTSRASSSTDGSEIVVAPESEAGDADIPVFILGTVFGILLHQREQIVLHASAVRVNGKAVLFCGASGAGKSTLAAALAQRGYPLVTDDVCTLTLDGAGAPLVHPDGRQLKFWAQAIERLDLAAQRGERVRASLEKFYVEPGEVFTEPLALGAVYALREARPPLQAGDRTAERGRRGAIAAPQRLSAVAGAAHEPEGELFPRRHGDRQCRRDFLSDPRARFHQNAGGHRVAGGALAGAAADGASGMIRTIWLASYPKSGNTWFRMLVANLSATDGKPVDINDLTGTTAVSPAPAARSTSDADQFRPAHP